QTEKKRNKVPCHDCIFTSRSLVCRTKMCNIVRGVDPLMHRYWDNIRLFHSGDSFFKSVLEDFRNARETIQIETYIFEVDRLTRLLIEEMRAARQRGVRIQILVDGWGSFFWINSIARICNENEFEFQVYQPLPTTLSRLRRLALPFFFRFLRFLRRWNLRNHRKIILIDKKVAYLGSMNWTQVHSESALGTSAWRDSGVRLEGESVRDIVYFHERAWMRAKRGALRTFFRRKGRGVYQLKTSWVRFNANLTHRLRIYTDFLRRIRRARRQIRLTSAYFLPRRSLYRALIRAARRGVRVQILVPGPSDVPVVKLAAFEVVRGLIRAGIEVYEYQRTILHAKISILDDWATIGSANLNHRSLLHDLEVEAVLADSESLENLNNQFEIDLQSSRRCQENDFREIKWHWRVLSRIAYWFRYIL
ncbi:MAG: phosphatidylserine/phosphatidylglycerophosphate/cardiolipin synthase family protein, partial [Bdellovibrionaceae bacterium]|nr:phosphatidylserine/phosphatidylglycerophosphate/cardiolipin synthase family protein [Pseudobdellovibrionaceae bacterium]